MENFKMSMVEKRIKLQEKVTGFIKEERGDVGVKQIAITVAIIVILGFVISAFQTKMPNFVQDIWDMLKEKIDAIK